MLNVIDFVEDPSGLNLKLYPIQRLILKVIFGVPLDYKPAMISLWSKFREHKVLEISESTYLQMAYNEGRCNIQSIPEGGFHEAAIFLGRRSGKDTLLAIMAAYRLYCLLQIPNPQEYYGLVPGSPIDFTFITSCDDSAYRTFSTFENMVSYCPFFEPYIVSRKKGERLHIATERERNRCDAYPTISVRSYPASTNACRGPASVFLGFNELAHFKNADDCYCAATPGTTTFATRDVEGEWQQDSHIIALSSAWYNTGRMYELHKLALDKGAESGIFTLREKTVNVNPNIIGSSLKREYDKNPVIYSAEFESDFLKGDSLKKKDKG